MHPFASVTVTVMGKVPEEVGVPERVPSAARVRPAGRALAVAGNGRVLLTGVFQGTMDLGAGPLSSSGGSDIVLASFPP